MVCDTLKEVTDFSAYNKNRSTLARGLRGAAVFSITGDDNRVIGTKLTVRGSFPYGYGSIYGVGSDNVFGLDKRCGILIKGVDNTIDGCEVQQRAFGHGIYMQKPVDRTVIRNTLVEGVMRPSQDLYLERDPEDLLAYAPLSDFRLSKSGQKIELTILPSPHAIGPHNVADIQGDDHDIVFHRMDGPIDTTRRPIVVTGDGSTIRNETEYPMVLQSSASGNRVASLGPVTDLGTNNRVSHLVP